MKHWLLLTIIGLIMMSCADDGIEYNDDGVVKANKVGTKLVLTNLYKHDGRNFKPVRLHREPSYYLFYYAGSW